MRRAKWLSSVTVLSLVLCAAASSRDKTPKSTSTSHGQKQGNGDKLFQTHCSRCHAAPTDLSPRAAKAVLQHMRVRAMLSRKDEEAILEYIAP